MSIHKFHIMAGSFAIIVELGKSEMRLLSKGKGWGWHGPKKETKLDVSLVKAEQNRKVYTEIANP